MEQLYIVKIGGNIIDDEERLHAFLQSFAAIKGHKILVHGGGKLATRLADQLAIPQQMVDGRRITDQATLDVVTMVYAGLVNKKIVAKLQSFDCNAIGLTGADGNIIQSHKRINAQIDYGFVGDVDSVNSNFIHHLIQTQNTPILSPITHDKKGLLLNTNADTIAQETARAMSKLYAVVLIYSFEKAGVLLDANDDNTVIPTIKPKYYQKLKEEQKIFAGMIPKLDNAFAAIDSGVQKVIIGKAEELTDLLTGKSGTSIENE